MNADKNLEIFLVTIPGLERLLRAEAAEKGFKKPKMTPGGVRFRGKWPEVWRANLELRGASKVLVRIGSFEAMQLSQLDKRAQQFPWGDFLRPDVSVRVEASCSNSRIYHSGAVVERFSKAIEKQLGASVSRDGDVTVKVRIADNTCTISIDTSGDGLHKRGHKEAVNKAPLRETLASLFLRHCGYDGGEPVVDPMCGSGTFPIEAAEIAAGLQPGRSRTFAFERLASYDPEAWQNLRRDDDVIDPGVRFYGSDRDGGAIRISRANAERAGVSDLIDFQVQSVDQLTPPCAGPGLVIANPPYGARIGDVKQLKALYRTFGETVLAQFSGWRVGLVTNTESLAKATRLPFTHISDPVSHGGIKVKVYATDPLAGL